MYIFIFSDIYIYIYIYIYNSSEIIDHTCDDNGINLLNAEEESYTTSIHSINETNDISMNHDDNFIHK